MNLKEIENYEFAIAVYKNGIKKDPDFFVTLHTADGALALKELFIKRFNIKDDTGTEQED